MEPRKPKKQDEEQRSLPRPRPEGQPEQQDATTGDEGGGGLYGPPREGQEERRVPED